jgi:RNA polymerase sigma-70 factor (ECF subfamily)
MRSDDGKLVRDARGGSQSALAELFDRYWESVWRASYAVTGRRDLADDVTQDAFLRAIAALDTFDDGRPFGPWITRIGVNRAIDIVRHNSREIGVADVRVDGGQGHERDWELIRTVRGLDADRRLVVVLHYWVNLTIREISEILQIPPGTVTSRLSRALDDLRASLKEETDD